MIFLKVIPCTSIPCNGTVVGHSHSRLLSNVVYSYL